MEVRFHPEALAELGGANDWYAARSERAAAALAVEVERAVGRMREAPLRWPSFQHGTRKIRVRRFPFVLVYRIGMDEIQVVAVAHIHRRPGYWRDRPPG